MLRTKVGQKRLQHFMIHTGQKPAADWNAIYVETALPSGNLPTKVWILQKGVSA